MPTMCGAAVIVTSDEEWKPRSRAANSNPADRIAASVSRVVRQPPSARVQYAASNPRWASRNARLSARTCS